MRWLFLFFGLLFITSLPAQENISLDWDVDSIFDEEPQDEEAAPQTDEITVMQMLNRRSLTFSASYGFSFGISPGWKETPWYPFSDEDEKYDKGFAWTPVLNINTSFGLDAQISSVLGIKSTFHFVIPDSVSYFGFFLGDLFFDYNLFDTVYIRGGKYNLKWGISPNYSFTNLLIRTPSDDERFRNDSLILKADVPAGIGGFQLLALTRSSLTGNAGISRENVGIGGKFNLALRKFDLDAGVFYHFGMPFRLFLSLKTTFRGAELYSEGLAAFDAFDTRRNNMNGEIEESSGISGAFNLGFTRDFLDNKLGVNWELFLNTEGHSFFYSTRTDFENSKVSPFISGLNIALNVLYRLGGSINPRFFVQTLYAVQENSALFTPGVRINPWPHIELSFAVPMTLGSVEGYYYKYPAVVDRSGNKRRFAIVILLSLSGNLQYVHYF
jgi:hypothetical protein